MKFKYPLLIMMLPGMFCTSAVQAADNAMMSVGGVYSKQYNPWRLQHRQSGYINKRNSISGRTHIAQPDGVLPQQFHAAPLNIIPQRQYEYRRYVQQLNPYYEAHGGLPWWAGTATYGPWLGRNGFW